VTRFSARYATVLALLLALSLVPIAYGHLAAPFRDECSSQEALLDPLAIDPNTSLTFPGPHATDFGRGRFLGTIEEQRPDEVPMIVSIQRMFGLPNRLLEPASAMPGRREPDDVRFEHLETEHGSIPVHYGYERRGTSVRLTAYVMAHRGRAVRSPFRAHLASGPSAFVDGRFPITLFAASIRAHPAQLEPNLERVDSWLRSAWSHYLRVCGPGVRAPSSESAPR
jgi:hypothetical protein